MPYTFDNATLVPIVSTADLLEPLRLPLGLSFPVAALQDQVAGLQMMESQLPVCQAVAGT